jgi:nitrite reductase/ring-hydroxylating ferredoxin subunit
MAETARFVRVGRLDDIQSAGCKTVQANGHTLAVFSHQGKVYAVDNRCPHMGFPLQRGTVKDGILTCHWHHARFDLATGGTFDLWADDVRAFPVEVRDGEVWVDMATHGDPLAHHRQRLRDGLEQDLSLVIAKAVIPLVEASDDPVEAFRIALDFGARYRGDGWGQGLTILTCMANLVPYLDPRDRARAAFHGLAAVADDTAGMAPRFPPQPLPRSTIDPTTLKRWFRRFIEVRDAKGAERCLLSAIRLGHERSQIADMLLAAATDHRYISGGHVLDFTNKAFEALDLVGWEQAEIVLPSLVSGYAGADRMEESNAWRHPIDLVAILEKTFEALPSAAEQRARRPKPPDREMLLPLLLGEDPAAIAKSLLSCLREGSSMEELAGVVAYAAAVRIAQFHISNEFGDWNTALHTFTFANAVHQGLRRSPSVELLRGAFDAAMSVYLDRFLNVPATPLNKPGGAAVDPQQLLARLPDLLDRQQQVNEAGEAVARYLFGRGEPKALLAMLGHLLLREDRDFHTIQTLEAAFRQYQYLSDTSAGVHVLVAAARYLAAHAPTVRAEGQTYQIAYRLQRGEHLFEEANEPSGGA